MTRRGAPERRTIKVHCGGCRALLLRYRKGGRGGLVKCFVERIAEDRTEGDARCPRCGREFARPGEIAGRPVLRLISGRTFTRGLGRR